MASSQTSIDPHGRQGKSSAPTRMSWRAGMHGNEPTWWLVKRNASVANSAMFGVVELPASVRLEHETVEAVQQDDDEVLRPWRAVRAHRAVMRRLRLDTCAVHAASCA